MKKLLLLLFTLCSIHIYAQVSVYTLPAWSEVRKDSSRLEVSVKKDGKVYAKSIRLDSLVAQAAGGVSSFNSRTGAIIPQLSDYQAYYAAISHSHAQSDIVGLSAALNSKLDKSDGNVSLLNLAQTFASNKSFTTGTDLSFYNTADQVTNYERVRVYWSGNVFFVKAEKGGTGTLKNIDINGVRYFATTGNTTFGGTVDAGYKVDVQGTQRITGALTAEGGVKSTTQYNNQTGTSYTLALTDFGKTVTMTNASANTITIPLNSSVAFTVGTKIPLGSLGVGQTTVVPTAGVTLISADNSTKIRVQGSPALIEKTGTDTWWLYGDIL